MLFKKKLIIYLFIINAFKRIIKQDDIENHITDAQKHHFDTILLANIQR